MKILLVFVFMMFSTVAYSQGVRIKWEDNQGREFEISAPSGSFSYGMIQGDNISRDYSGKVSQVGSTFISYNYSGKVSQVGSVYISYDYNGKVSQVGGLYIKYDYNGNVTGTSGSVN
jgi:hypothetical protein